jgi:hypothetical protein
LHSLVRCGAKIDPLVAKPRAAPGGVRRRCLPSDEREAGRAPKPIGGLPAPAPAKLQGLGDIGREDEQVDQVRDALVARCRADAWRRP